MVTLEQIMAEAMKYRKKKLISKNSIAFTFTSKGELEDANFFAN